MDTYGLICIIHVDDIITGLWIKNCFFFSNSYYQVMQLNHNILIDYLIRLYAIFIFVVRLWAFWYIYINLNTKFTMHILLGLSTYDLFRSEIKSCFPFRILYILSNFIDYNSIFYFGLKNDSTKLKRSLFRFVCKLVMLLRQVCIVWLILCIEYIIIV